MKIKILVIFLFCSLSAYSQQHFGPYFNALNGMEDKQGATHLFYNMYMLSDDGALNINRDICHLDLIKKIDTVFFPGFAYADDNNTRFNGISDYKFWNNDPAKYLSCGWDGDKYDVYGYVRRYNQPANKYLFLGLGLTSVLISHQNDSLVLTGNTNKWFISSDGGENWQNIIIADSNSNYSLLTIHPDNDSIVFLGNQNILRKSIDRGKTSVIIDTITSQVASGAESVYSLIFDKNTSYLYKKNWYWPLQKNTLSVSPNGGEPFSWVEKYSSPNDFLFTTDISKSGNIYVADENKIYFSDNFGGNLKLFKAFNKKIIGLYKKPNSEKLYAAERYKLYEIEGDSAKVIKTLPIPTHLLEYYPLKIGNKQIYETKSYYYDTVFYHYGSLLREVLRDTVMANSKKYFVIKETQTGESSSVNYYYERADTATGMIYRYLSDAVPAYEVVIEDLTAEAGDTVFTKKYGADPQILFFVCSYYTSSKWNKTVQNMTYSFSKSGIGSESYSLLRGFGMDNYASLNDGAQSWMTLKGGVYNGVVYGDTVFTGVNDVKKQTPNQFSLSQNYPNPFNPTTIIDYAIPSENHVKIIVYNALGQIVKTLVDEVKSAGNYKTVFNGTGLSSGVYFYELSAGSLRQIKKLVLLK